MSYDVVIIGSGVLGLSTAIKIKQLDPSCSVAVIGDNRGSASRAAAAMLNVFAEVDSNTFATLAHDAKFQLAYEARDLWSEWSDCIGFGGVKLGTFVINSATA